MLFRTVATLRCWHYEAALKHQQPTQAGERAIPRIILRKRLRIRVNRAAYSSRRFGGRAIAAFTAADSSQGPVKVERTKAIMPRTPRRA